MNTDKSISDVLRNAVYAISEGYIFDVEDMFLRILKDSAQYPFCIKVFTPWIQKVVDHAMRTVYLAKESHKSFIPPVRDTLKVMEDITSGNSPATSPQDYHKQFDGPRLPQRDQKISPQPPSQLEVSLRTQQLLLQHIAEDRRKKEHLASELNVLNNRTRIIYLIADENKKRLWKLLRKFFSEKQLLNIHLQELYDYIDKGFTVEDFQDQSTPPLLVREPTTDLLHLKLRKLLDESEATSPTEKPTEGNVLSRVPPVAPPHIPSSAQPHVIILEGKSDAAKDEDNPITSEEEVTSDSSSGDSTD
jgi:hypothetical protein